MNRFRYNPGIPSEETPGLYLIGIKVYSIRDNIQFKLNTGIKHNQKLFSQQ